jgi:hypothetical protein
MTVDELIERLSILDENILKEAAEQPVLFLEAARYRVVVMRKRSEAVARKEYASSKLSLLIRAKVKATGDRITEDTVKSKVFRNKQYRVIHERAERTYEEEEFSKLLLEAYRMRRDAIRIIADAGRAEGISETAELERISARAKLHKEARKLADRRR